MYDSRISFVEEYIGYLWNKTAKHVENPRVYLSFKLLIIIFHQAQVVGNFSKVEDEI